MSSPKRSQKRTTALLVVLLAAASAHATLPPWLQHIIGASTVEQALYRSMHLPAVDALYPRPPKEAQAELAKLPADTPQLYELKARTDEQALDLPAAEADWKAYAAHAKDPAQAKLKLADFYHRQLRTPQEIATLREVAAAPPQPGDALLDPSRQRSWQTYLRILSLVAEQALPATESASTYEAFLARYPDEAAVYARALQWQLDQKNYPAVETLIARYKAKFPQDQTFPVRATALLESRRGNLDAALAVYDRAFQPLSPSDLVAPYFALLAEAHRTHAFLAGARARLAAHPDGPEALNALARLYDYDQQASRTTQAQATLDAFRTAREARNGVWSPEDLATLATLELRAGNYAEGARYNFALASLPGTLPSGEPAAQSGLSALVSILLTSAQEPLALGAGNLSLYRDIATLDQGPGYWNGILSLWLNGTSPASEYNSENDKAQAYFHRSKAAELLAQLDRRYPAAPQRPALHAQLVAALAQYGEPAAVIAAGKEYLAAFSHSDARIDIANLMADAYARQNDTASEFALYDSLLTELAARTSGQPLTSATRTKPASGPDLPDATPSSLVRVSDTDSEEAIPAGKPAGYSLDLYTTSRPVNPAADAYATLLDRYLARLTATHQIPAALAVLRRQLDRNPDDPALYERLAIFLTENNLTQAQEDLYKQAIAHFASPTGWYDKLARFYLRQKNNQAFTALTKQVTEIFSGTDLEAYFARVRDFSGPAQGGPQLAVQLNLYAAKRFPHDLVFVHNLLTAYQQKPTADPAAYEALLRQTWWADEPLGREFFAYLSRTGKLQSELADLGAPSFPASSERVGSTGAGTTSESNPAATRELAELNLWTSHYEQAAPLLSSLATLYPADSGLDDRAVSLFRSLSYLDATPASLTRAVAIQQNLLAYAPDDPERLATLGDLYAEATSTGGEDLATAAPFWRRIPTLHPGTPAGYLTSATIFWDYFQYDDALAQITQARTRFGQPALFGYEAGAIEENRHDLPAAIGEYVTAATQPPALTQQFNSFVALAQAFYKPPSDAADSNLQSTAQSFFGAEQAHARLLTLALRPATKALVSQAMSRLPNGLPALTLRADILVAQHRAAELPALFTAALAAATTPEQAAEIGALAQSHTLIPSYEAALQRQTVLTPDPVQKIELQYALARSLEARKQTPEASRIIAAVYAANPRILGVVRTTTDFYVRTNQPKQAIATLLEAGKAATPALAHDFTLEAATRANDSGDPVQARALALTLLPATPYDPAILAVVSTSYAKANDNAGLKSFYETQLDKAIKDPTLTRDDRKADVALLRRGLIPALTRMNDFEGATNQYIALLSAYPEDAGTAQEAALYALRYSRQPQLVGFLQATVKSSPKDSRFAILLAQTQTTFEDLPAALTAYDAAIAIRKDRADLYQSRVDLELRLQRFEPAAADFERLYLLTYKDPQWMVRLAELRARQQRPADAVKALQTAYIEGQPKLPGNYFTVASQLEKWNLLPEARAFAQQGIDLAGPALLTGPDASSGPTTYARILARLGKPEEALRTLAAARRTALAAPVPKPETTDDSSDADSADLAKSAAEERGTLIQSRIGQAFSAIGAAVDTYYTPEQKQAYAQALDTLHATDAPLAITAASAANLADREADWRKQQLLTAPLDTAASSLQPYTTLQQHRLAFADIAQTLEAYAARLKPAARRPLRAQAAQAWHNAGTPDALPNELRLTRLLAAGSDENRDKYLELLLHHDPAALNTLAAGKDETLADAAATYVLAHGTPAQAATVLGTRGKTRGALWTTANLALAGLYDTAPAPATTKAQFTTILRANDTIADRLTTKADPAQTLTGDLWFGFASRFGIALGPGEHRSADLPTVMETDDFLPALLEQSPTLPAGYLDLARTYGEAGDTPAALAEYAHALELAPDSIATHDEIAVLQSHAHNTPAALEGWRTALALLRRTVERNAYSESFYTNFATVLAHLGQRNLTATLRPEIEAILRPEFARNGNYRSNELLEAVYKASATPQEGAAEILTLSTSASDPGQLLQDLFGSRWLPAAGQQLILERRLQLTRELAAGDNAAASDLPQIQSQLLTLYLTTGNDAGARTLLTTLTPDQRNAPAYARADILLAARAGQLAARLATFRDSPATAPAPAVLASAATALAHPVPPRQPDQPAAHLLRESVFEQKQLTNTLLPTDFLSLAESRIATGDLPGAVALLHRLTLRPPASPDALDSAASADTHALGSVIQDETSAVPFVAYDNPNVPLDPYANTDSAAALLESTHHLAEAVPLLQSLVQSVPWNATYRLRLAQAQLPHDTGAAASALIDVARDSSAPYAIRATAAQMLATAVPLMSSNIPAASAHNLGSAELDLLASSKPTAATARQPYFVQARLLVGGYTNPDQPTLLREAIAIAPNGIGADRTRLQLLQLTIADKNPAFALAILEVLRNTPAQPASTSTDADADTDTSADDTTDASDAEATTPDPAEPTSAALPPILATLDTAAQTHLAGQIAAAYQRQQDPQTALGWLLLAAQLDPQQPNTAQIADLKLAVKLETRNALRLPVLKPDLVSPTNVRPRLTLAQLKAEEAQ